MLPDFRVMPGRKHSDASVRQCAPPTAGLLAMHGPGGHEHVCLLVIERHEVVFILNDKRCDIYTKRVSCLRLDRDRTLLGMLNEYTAQQAAQHRFICVLCRPRMDRQ